ncbi:MAG: carboxypeptidase regulatory-like domain-containing protein [Planctomycetes bacterium]|nr:carboxypeptidase regulatory-like domain-containing protein [Planctomycetota bacterium]
MKQLLVFMACLACCVMVAGCGGGSSNPATVPVTGTVQLNGQAVEGATVTFVGEASTRPATGTTDAQGEFTLTSFEPNDGAPPGDYSITITKYADAGAGTAPDEVDAASPEAMYGDGGPDAAGSPNELPAKYETAVTTTLKETVTAGQDNNFTFNLDDS